MAQLDNRSIIKQIDTENYISHLFDAAEQIVSGFDLGESLRIPALYAQSKSVVLLAVGEMLPVAYALQSMAREYARVPVLIVDDYVLPHWVSSESLVIAIDYYGTSEQVIAAYREASKRRSRLLAVSVESVLASEARRVRSPHVPITYGSPARTAFYYMLGCLVSIFKKLDLIDIREATVTEASVLVHSLMQNLHPDVATYQNSAKQLAEKIVAHPAIIVGGGPLFGMARKWQMTLAATSKLLVIASTLSDFNDTIINGLRSVNKGSVSPAVIMLQSKYDHQRNKMQQTLTYQVAQAQKVVYEQIFMHPSGSLFGEIVLSSFLGDMVSYYAALLNGVNPSTLEATAFIKDHLPLDTLFE